MYFNNAYKCIQLPETLGCALAIWHNVPTKYPSISCGSLGCHYDLYLGPHQGALMVHEDLVGATWLPRDGGGREQSDGVSLWVVQGLVQVDLQRDIDRRVPVITTTASLCTTSMH